MTVDELRVIACKLPGVTEDIKWEDHVCFNIGGKMFLVTSPDTLPPTASFKVAENEFDEIIARPGITRQKHLGRHHWVHLDDINSLHKKEWELYVKNSYELVLAKLPAKFRNSLKK